MTIAAHPTWIPSGPGASTVRCTVCMDFGSDLQDPRRRHKAKSLKASARPECSEMFRAYPPALRTAPEDVRTT
jgi:hypothetical protein